MILYTSNFAKSGNNPKARSIALYGPKAWRGFHYKKLAPTKKILDVKDDHAKYTKLYRSEILKKLDPNIVARELGSGAIMLCWEKEGEFCHRNIVAEWFRRAGIDVKEFNPAECSKRESCLRNVRSYPDDHPERRKIEIALENCKPSRCLEFKNRGGKR